MCTSYPILEKWALLLPNHQYLKKMLPFGLLHSIVFMVAGWSSTQQISFFTWDENLLIILIISLCQRHQCTPKHALFNLIRIYSLIHTHKWNVKPQSFGIFWQNVYFWSPFEQLLLSLPETENKPYCESWWGVKWQSPCGWNLDFERIFLPSRLFANWARASTGPGTGPRTGLGRPRQILAGFRVLAGPNLSIELHWVKLAWLKAMF